MLPTQGFFKEIECPYYVSTIKGSCNRPHCHFKHYQKDGDYDYDYTEFMPVEEDSSAKENTEEENFQSSEDEEDQVSQPEDISELSPDVPEESNGANEPEPAPDIPSEEDEKEMFAEEEEFDAQDALLKFKKSLMSSIKEVIESFPKVFGKFINQRDFNKMIDDFIRQLLVYEETEEDVKLTYNPTPIIELKRNERRYKTQLPYIPECVRVLQEPTIEFNTEDLKFLEDILQSDDLFGKEELLTDTSKRTPDPQENEQSKEVDKSSKEREDSSSHRTPDDLKRKSSGHKRKSRSPSSSERSELKSSSSSKHSSKSSSSSSHHSKRHKHSHHRSGSRSKSSSESHSKSSSSSSKHKSSSSRSRHSSEAKEKKSVDTIVISSESSNDNDDDDNDDCDNDLSIDDRPASPEEKHLPQNITENDSANDNKQSNEDYDEPEYIKKKKKHRISHIDIFGVTPTSQPKTHKSAPLNPLQRFKQIQEKGLNRSSSSTPSPKISHVPNVSSILSAQRSPHQLSINKNSLLMSDVLKRAELKKTIAQTSNKKTGRVAHTSSPTVAPTKPLIQVDGKTRISLVVRQTCLDRIFALYSKYVPPDLARSRSLQIELETYNKCQLAKSYQNSIANNILRIKREQESFRIGSRPQLS